MPAFSSESFTIAATPSSSLGINGCYIVKVNESETSMPFISSNEIVEDYTPYKNEPTFYLSKKRPLEFELKFSLLDDEFTHDRLIEMGRLFGQDKYSEFISNDDPLKKYYVIRNGGINLIHYGLYKGFFSMNLRCNAPYPYLVASTPLPSWDCTASTPTTIEVVNSSNVPDGHGDNYFWPEMWITLDTGVTSITITNLSDSNRQFGFTGLTSGETLYINNQLKKIISSTGNARIGKMLTGHPWLRLVPGTNQLRVSNKATIIFKYEYPIYA